MAAGEDVAPTKATIADLCALVFADYRLRNLRGINVEEWRYDAHVKPALGSMLAEKFGMSHVREYVAMGRNQGALDSSINRELSMVRRGFRLAMRTRHWFERVRTL